MQRFLGKVVVVVGGSSGIGLASAKAFANEGAQVVIAGRDSNKLTEAARAIGPDVLAHEADVSDLRQLTDMFIRLQQNLGRIDVLFVNAGVGLLRPIESVSESDWDLVLDINLKGVFFSVKGALPMMRKGSAIVLTGSMAALKGASGGSVYAASKAGLRSLGRSFAAELVDRGIRVNVVSPGFIDTPLFDHIEGLSSEAVPTMRQKMVESTPMKRMGDPAEVATAVLFLASDAAAFITGTDFLVDGGIASF